MTSPPSPLTHRDQILRILDAAIRAVDPAEAVRAHVTVAGNRLRIGPATYSLDELDRIFVVGGGKAGTPMAAALYELLGSRITAGSVNVKYGHTAGAGGWRVRFEGRAESGVEPSGSSTPTKASPPERYSYAETGRIAIVEAGHPVPDAAGQAGAARIADLLADLTPRDLVIVLISGGGSALLPLPVAGISLADYQALTGVLLRCGADITAINAIRKHCSQLQGGHLARLAQPAQVATLILSDVVGTPLDVIASGPTVPDPTTFADAVAVLNRYGVLDQVPASVRGHLLAGAADEIPDTPKPGDPLFGRVTNLVIGDNASAGRAAVTEARRLGFHSVLLTTFVQGEAREVAKVMAGLAQGIALGQSDFATPACLVLGGETTVTVRGQGTGGRNQELALAAAIALDGAPLPSGVDVAIVSLGTDGTDGPTDAAGGIVTRDTIARGRARGLDARAALTNNDSYHYLGALGDLVVTGPTNTNVNDLIFVFVTQR
ncbi:MAG: glycerate kinase [Chloroflexi bacterium]|nr:glycerate kinase [Chloroflexota bacterium]